MRRVAVILLTMVLMLAVVPSVMADRSEDKPIPPGQLKKITFVHYAKPDGSPVKPDKPGKPSNTDSPDYKLMGVVIPDTMTFAINAPSQDAFNEIVDAFGTWDLVTGNELFNDAFGPTSNSGADYNDGVNTVSWGTLGNGIIAQATVWYIDYRHPKLTDEIVQADIVLNSSLPWGIDPDDEGQLTIDAYDIQNIVTHEVGHVVGLADLYADEHSAMTMYGYGFIGETQKISLEPGDIAGAQVLYGVP